jgi:hypothetical protein
MNGSNALEQNGAGQPTLRDHGFYGFHLAYAHPSSVLGDDWSALNAEAFARFFGTPLFLVAQTVIVAIWIVINCGMVGIRRISLHFWFETWPNAITFPLLGRPRRGVN